MRLNTLLRSIWLLLASSLSVAAASVAFDISAQPAPAALDQFIKQSAAQVIYLKTEIEAVRTNAVKGDYEPEQALRLLLQDTGLIFQRNSSGKFVVKPAAKATGTVRGNVLAPDGHRARGVSVRTEDGAISTLTDAQGDFVLTDLPPGQYVLVVAASGYQPLHVTAVKVQAGRGLVLSPLQLRRAVAADDATALEPFVVAADGVTELTAYQVKGEKIKSYVEGNIDLPRNIDDPKPYYIFDAAAIDASGAATTEEFLRNKLTMMTNYGSALRRGVADSDDVTATSGNVSLRGLSSGQTVILIDGRRMSNVDYSSPDINSVPVGLIDRIEVLPSSGSAVYGGGAVGGVVNIITKRNYQGGELKLTYDNTFRSDTGRYRADLNYGFNLFGGRTQVTLATGYSDGNPLTVGDRESLLRSYVARAQALNPTGLPPQAGASGYLGTHTRVTSFSFFGNSPLTLKSQYGGQTLSSTFVTLPDGYRGAATSGVAGLITNAGVDDTVNGWPDLANGFTGKRYVIQSLPELTTLHATLRQKITPWLEGYFDASTDENRNETTMSSIGFLNYVVYPNAPSSPFAGPVLVSIPTTAGEAPFRTSLKRERYVAGLSAKLPNNWQMIADFTWNKSSSHAVTPRANLTAIQTAITTGLLDPFVDQRTVPTNFKPYLSNEHTDYKSKLNQQALRASGPLPKIFGIQPALASGIDWIQDANGLRSVATIYPNNASTNQTVIFLPSERKSTSYYSELTLPLISPQTSRPGLRMLEFQIAARRDEYTAGLQRTVGDGYTNLFFVGTDPISFPALEWKRERYTSTNPTYAVRYKPVEDLMLRASFAKGFLPPTAEQVVPSGQSPIEIPYFDSKRGYEMVLLSPFPTGGNPNVKPERSTNWSYGLVFTPHVLPGLRLSVDYTRIEKRNNLAWIDAQTIIDNEDQFPGRVTRAAVLPGDPFGVGTITGVDDSLMNLFSTKTRAYDFSLSYEKETETKGTFAFEALATLTRSYRQRASFFSSEEEYVGIPVLGAPLKLRMNFSTTWTYHKWQTGWTTVYFDRYQQSNSIGLSVPSQTTHDLFVRYKFGVANRSGSAWRQLFDRTELLFGVRNVFDKAPAFDQGAYLARYFMSPFGDTRGASYYFTLKRTF